MTVDAGKKIVVRCRAIIVHKGKLLVVRHRAGAAYVALPGGHLEWGEDVRECTRREIVEELGVEPSIGRLLYVNNFVKEQDGVHSVEFFFEVTNGAAFVDCESRVRSHAYEIAEILWMHPADDLRLLPDQVHRDFREGKLESNDVRFMRSS